jgi:signal transduction histidine kinase
LTGIGAAAELLRRGSATDAAVVQELAASIAEETAQMRRDLEHLVAFCAGGSELPPTVQSIDVTAECRKACRYICALAEQKSISVHLQVGSGVPLVCGDPVNVGRILGNLLSNAVKYTPAHGQVAVHVASEMRQGEQPWGVRVSVADSGPGIAAGEEERIFAPFYRSPSRRHAEEGMGLGLAIARRLAMAHGGDLAVASTSGRGATFVLRLPA